RNYVMLSAGGAGLDSLMRLGPRENLDGKHMLSVRAIKAYADGALGSRGAKLLEPYADEPGHTGFMVTPPEQLEKLAVAALETGLQLNVHAIGDRANRTVLDVLERAFEQVPVADHRFRIEHAQVISPPDMPRFAQLGVIPSMQAVHQTSDMYWAEDRLGSERARGAYAWRSLLNTGVVIAGGSDFPVESANPLYSFHAAVTRQDEKNWPPGGWQPQERMTRAEALRHLTIWPAYASFQEDRAGSITPGKLADLVVLSKDIMTIPPEEILSTSVELTILGGRIVYDARRDAAYELRTLRSPTTAELRGLSVVDARVVWASGARGTVLRSTNGGERWQVVAVPAADSLDFRDVEAFDSLTAYVLSAGEDGRIYKTTDGGRSWMLQFRNTTSGAFFDCFDFWDARHGIAMSDPVAGRYLLVRTDDGATWKPIASENSPVAGAGEAAFAASGTCVIAAGTQRAYVATGGGAQARVLVSDDRGRSWRAQVVPVPAGAPSAGIFSLAFTAANTGLALGGDYQKPEVASVVAYTEDGGQSWRAAGKTTYVSGAAFVNGSDTVVAAGTQGTRISRDRGVTWQTLDTQEYHAVEFAPDGTGFVVGPAGRLGKLIMR
ncbi:MAG: amidohydrolase family protein, partial [Gemmatimonadota bacterium]